MNAAKMKAVQEALEATGGVVTEAAKLVLHQLAVLFAEPIVVAMQQVTKLDVVKTSVIAL